VRSFRPLIDPNSILWACFFGGPLAGGLLFGANYRSMRMPRAAALAWAGGFAVMLLAIAIFFPILADGGADATSRSTRSGSRMIVSIVSVALGSLVARHQLRPFKAFVNADRRPRPLFWHALGACVIAWIVVIAIAAAATRLFGAHG